MLLLQLRFQLTGGCTRSVFPCTEEALLADGDYQKALEFVAARKKMDRYHSMMDFLFCEIFTSHQGACFRFYEDRGPALRDVVSAEAIECWDAVLMMALDLARQRFKKQQGQSWSSLRQEVLQAAA